MIQIVDISSQENFQNCFYYQGKQEFLYDNHNCFQVVRVNSIEDITAFTTTDIAYSYRGQANHEWPLKTSIERFFENRNLSISKTEIENKIFQKYRAEFSIFSKELGYDPNTQKPLDALSDIQHYGGPTRLLDFTSSFNTALFFATFNNFKYDSAVYCIRNLMFNTATHDIREILKGQNFAPGVEESLPPSKDKDKLLKWHSPERMNKRLKNQNGYFLYPGSVEISFEEALAYSFETSDIVYKMQQSPILKEIILRSSIIKLIIPKEMNLEILRYLKKSGTTASILFPDHYGAIQSLYEIDTERF